MFFCSDFNSRLLLKKLLPVTRRPATGTTWITSVQSWRWGKVENGGTRWMRIPIGSMCGYVSLRIQVCPKKGINPTILLWGWDWDHETYSREGYGSVGYGIFTLVDFYGKCRQIYHTWMVWDIEASHVLGAVNIFKDFRNKKHITFYPKIGKWSNLNNMFQNRWFKHHLALDGHSVTVVFLVFDAILELKIRLFRESLAVMKFLVICCHIPYPLQRDTTCHIHSGNLT